MSKRFFLAAVLLTASVAASAEPPNLYWGASFGDYEVNQRDVGGDTSSATDFGLRLGYEFGKFLGVEARAGLDSGGVGGNSDVDYAGVFGRFNLPYEKTNIYLLLGASEVRVDGESVDDDEYDPVAGGIGIELYGSERTAITLEYMSYSDESYSGISLGIKHHFNMPSFR